MINVRNIFIVFILFVGIAAHSQVITTIAGNNTIGYSGDGGPAVGAKLSNPFFVLPDAAGNVYIADWGNDCVRKVNAAGIITTIAGNRSTIHSGDGGPAVAAGIAYPQSMAIDKAGNLYISEGNSDRYLQGGKLVDSLAFVGSCIRKIDIAGIITTIAGNGLPGYSGDGGPATAAQFDLGISIATDARGNIYIADYGNMRIRKINTKGIITTVAGIGAAGFSGDSGIATKAQLFYPYGIAVDGAGNIFIADSHNNRIRKVDTAGIITTIAGTGAAGYGGDSAQATAAQLHFPAGIAVDGAGNLYIADQSNTRVRKINTGGIITTIAGNGAEGYTGDGGPPIEAALFYPNDVAVDKAGHIFIADNGSNTIRKISVKNAGTTTPAKTK